MLTFKRGTIKADSLTQFRKKVDILAARIDGPFQVDTPQGMKGCEDGYLIIDDGGNPGLMSKDLFERQFEPIERQFEPLEGLEVAVLSDKPPKPDNLKEDDSEKTPAEEDDFLTDPETP